MGSLTEMASLLSARLALPEMRPERCVHSRLATASCLACQQACPVGAWVIDDEQIGIREDLCDGCGLCAAACPEGAIQQGHAALPIRDRDGVSVVFLDDGRFEAREDRSSLVCISSLGLSGLARLYRQGVRHCYLQIREPSDRQEALEAFLEAKLSDFNRFLKARRLPLMEWSSLPSARFRALLKASAEPGANKVLDRRGFLRGVFGRSLQSGLEASGLVEREAEDFIPIGRLLPRQQDAEALYFLPEIDASRCNGCDACSQVCAHNAIDHVAEGSGYRIDAEGCSGCHLCADGCDQGAITIRTGARQKQDWIPLRAATCVQCGMPFHLPTVWPETALCRICSVTSHHAYLFQLV